MYSQICGTKKERNMLANFHTMSSTTCPFVCRQFSDNVLECKKIEELIRPYFIIQCLEICCFFLFAFLLNFCLFLHKQNFCHSQMKIENDFSIQRVIGKFSRNPLKLEVQSSEKLLKIFVLGFQNFKWKLENGKFGCRKTT